MNEDDSINVTGVPVNLYVDDARVIIDNLPIGRSRDTTTEDCYDSGDFITKRNPSLIGEKCPICKNSLREEYTGLRGTPGGNVQRRSSAVYVLGCGHAFHAGCLLDHLDGDDSFVTLLNEDNNQTVARVPRQTIMSNEVLIGDETSGIICPEPTCFKRCYTAEVHMLLEYFIGEEHERVPPGRSDNMRRYDSEEYTGSDPPPEEARCAGTNCIISGGKRKTKNKTKKSKKIQKGGKEDFGTWKDGSSVFKDKKGFYIVQWDPKKNMEYNKYLKNWKPEPEEDRLVLIENKWRIIKSKPSRKTGKKTKKVKRKTRRKNSKK